MKVWLKMLICMLFLLLSLSHVQLFGTLWTAACQASQSFKNSWSLLKLMSIESMMPPSHLILCHPLLLLPSIFSSIRVFFQWVGSSQQVAKVLELQIQHQSFQWYSGLISFRTDWLGLLAVQGTVSKSLLSTTVQKYQLSVLSLLYGPTLISVHNYWKNHSFDYTDLCAQSGISAF